MLWSTINSLRSPETVAKFQRFFGVMPKRSISNTNNGEKNSKFVSSNMSNDIAFTDSGSDEIEMKYNLRSRKIQADNLKTTTDEPSGEDSEVTDVDSDGFVDDFGSCLVTNKFWFWLFTFGAGLGNDPFYIIFFPYWFWNVDGYVCRRIVFVWSIIMYLGQLLKDIIRIPRPPSPPVMRLERRYAEEYGMPSTHAVVGFCVPVTLMILTKDRYEYNIWFGLTICVCWTSLICLSRIYLGMHTVLDVICGLLLSCLLLPILAYCMDPYDHFQLRHPYAPLIVTLIHALMLTFYPSADKWTVTRGDTAIILGIATGISIGSWINFQYHVFETTPFSPPYKIKPLDLDWVVLMTLRSSLGIALLIATRVFVKILVKHSLCYLLKYDVKDEKTLKALLIEIPHKFITYCMVAFNTVYFIPHVFRLVGIERITYYTEF